MSLKFQIQHSSKLTVREHINDSGYLIAIHLDQGCFCDELSCSTDETDCENQIDYDNQFCPVDQINSTNQTNFESQINSTKLISRNARARVICSKYIFDLLDNKYNNAIKLHFE